MTARAADPQADPSHWALLDSGSAEVARRARRYLEEITPLLSAAGDGTVSIQHPFGGELQLLAGAGPDGAAPDPLF